MIQKEKDKKIFKIENQQLEKSNKIFKIIKYKNKYKIKKYKNFLKEKKYATDMETIKLLKFNKCLCDKKIKFLNCESCKRKYLTFLDIDNKISKDSYFSKGRVCVLNLVGIECEHISTGSHSISKSNHLSTLKKESTSSIYKISKQDSHDRGYIINNDFRTIGINKLASVFHGLCKRHDDIYKPIDNNFDYRNREHLLLLAHRQSLYEINSNASILTYYNNMKKFLDTIKLSELNEEYRKNFSKIYNQLLLDLEQRNILFEMHKKNFNKFKDEFEIVIENTGKAKFSASTKSNFLFSAIKFQNKFDFTFSCNFANKYDFNKNIIYEDWDNINANFQVPTIGLINDNDFSYFYCICLKDDNNLRFIKSLTESIKKNINTLLKYSIMTHNTYFSEEFVHSCKKKHLPTNITIQDSPFKRKYTSLYDDSKALDSIYDFIIYLYNMDNLLFSNSFWIDGIFYEAELSRINNINYIDYLNIIEENKIIDSWNNYE